MDHSNSKQPIKEIVTDLTAILDKERDALVRGEYETVSSLFDQKKLLADTFEAWFAALDDDAEALAELDKPAVMRLQQALNRNEAILSGAQNGIEQGRARLASISRKSKEVGVYDASGQRL